MNKRTLYGYFCVVALAILAGLRVSQGHYGRATFDALISLGMLWTIIQR
jgi:hypothetical protein